MKNIVLKASNIKKTYNKIKVLKDVSLSLFESESIAIMGESGEGKTTLLHILGHLEKRDKGKLEILNKNSFSPSDINKHIGFIFQSYNLLEDLSIIDNVLMPAHIARKDIKKNSKYYKKALSLIEEIQLSHRITNLAKTLSGGERQRVAIARAFINDPDIIFADEPSGNLDNKNSEIIHSLLINFAKKLKKSLIIATHNNTLSSLCDKKFILKDGYLI